MPTKCPIYRLTVWVQNERELFAEFERLAALHRAVGIITSQWAGDGRKQRHLVFAIWLVGKEVGEGESMNVEYPTGNLIASANGFGEVYKTISLTTARERS
ncbi:hypothetical protein CMI37_00520 [Candidatus Pacearchaeota archaeon]|nr:hypothetical protein [Candidatus Pacearchaeota archaeon]|tara:strand:- start:47 stop:349 length:303 start_codon:yes stop_codon:yes gene_type:complete